MNVHVHRALLVADAAVAAVALGDLREVEFEFELLAVAAALVVDKLFAGGGSGGGRHCELVSRRLPTTSFICLSCLDRTLPTGRILHYIARLLLRHDCIISFSRGCACSRRVIERALRPRNDSTRLRVHCTRAHVLVHGWTSQVTMDMGCCRESTGSRI